VAATLDLLTALSSKDYLPDHPSFAETLAIAVGRQQGDLYQAFDLGLDRANLAKLPFVSERQLREAVRQFSPFEEGGLGTYDFLRSIPQIDQLFLFCSQYLFYTERDVLRGPS
jgi:hypothetical protein